MQVPRSTIDVAYKANNIEVRDQGMVKRIKCPGRTFDDVLADLQQFLYLRGCNTPRSILKFIMKRVGLPNIKRFPDKNAIREEDIVELSEALGTVDTLRDMFLSTGVTVEIDAEMKKQVKFLGAEEKEEIAQIIENRETLWTEDAEVNLVFSFNPENTLTEALPKRERKKTELANLWGTLDEEAKSEVVIAVKAEPAQPEVEYLTPMEPGVAKVLILGEEGVGMQSILAKGGFKANNDAISTARPDSPPVVFSKSIEQAEETIQLDVWSFGEAMKARMPKTEFYTGTGVVIVAYSVVDRWSFESVEFWVREASSTLLTTPPVIVVGSKIDLRDAAALVEEAYEKPVSHEEGKRLAAGLSQRLGADGKLHPVTFVETSSETGEGIEELMKIVAGLWLANERVSLPLIEVFAAQKPEATA